MSDCLLFLEQMKSFNPSWFLQNEKEHIVKVWNTLRFLDSFHFMSQSLDSLTKPLKKKNFALLKHYFSETSPNKDWILLCEKGLLSFRNLYSFEKFKKPLPPYGNDWRKTLTGKLMSLKISTRKQWIFITHFNAALWVTTTIYI